MSSPGDQLASIQTLPESHRSNAIAKSDRVPQEFRADSQQSDIANQAAEDANSLNAQAARLNANRPRLDTADSATANSLVGRKNIAATQNSIFASQDASNETNAANPQQVALDGSNNGIQPTQALNASQNSIFAGQPDQVARDMAKIPLPDARKVGEVQDMALAGFAVPSEIEVASADPIAADEATAVRRDNTTSQASKDRSIGNVPAYDQALTDSREKPAHQMKRSRTLADFFRKKKPTETASFDQDRFGKKRTLSTSAIPNMKTAVLGDDALPGVNANAMMPMPTMSGDEQGEGGEDRPAGLMKLASLPGMARLAPNGLWTQTDQVEIRCLRPGLINMLKQVEQHYKRPVVVTSGFRDTGHNRVVGGARHSLHTLCAAADIQVEGVTKWELADYLRSLPGRGGVGTYCHTDSVHIDIGGERDWNWRCRRRRG